ncbi:MAG: glycoside hydrolase family 66 protein [Desulfocurvibacter africanus]
MRGCTLINPCLAILLLLLGIVPSVAQQAEAQDNSDSPVRITSFHPDKARYSPGEEIALIVEIRNRSRDAFMVPLALAVSHLGQEVHTDSREMSLAPDETVTETFTFPAPEPDFRGYLANVTVGEGEPAGTGIDVSSTATRFPRYGYVSDFTLAGQAESEEGIRELSQEFHLNMFQFYDWFWRHEKFIKREGGEISLAWTDLFGRVNVWPVILELVNTAHEYNSLALSYVMSYAAREDYEQLWPISPSWGLFDGRAGVNQLSVNLNLGPGAPAAQLFLFNPANEGWQDWIIEQYVEAINLAGFDGLHIDQLGPRYDVFLANGEPADLPEAFVSFLDRVDQRLEENDPDRAVSIFNLVDGEVEGWAVPEVASADNTDILFSELWFETNTYAELLAYIEYLHELGGERAVVLAGYSNYNQAIGPIREAEEAASLNGVEVAALDEGFTGTGYVEDFVDRGDSITWYFEGNEEPTDVTFVARYANATDVPATRNVYLDDRLIGTMQFSPRDHWSTWALDAWAQAEVGPGRHSLRIAYDRDNIGVVNIDHLQFGEFDEDSVRLQNAVMFAGGASHIQLGDDIQALAHEYYPNRTKSLTASLRRALRHYYDFITAYENLLFDPDIERLGHAGDSLRITTGQPVEPPGAGRIFTLLRRKQGYDILHLINLVGVENEFWRDRTPTPEFQENVGLRYYAESPEEIGAVWLASPDYDAGKAEQLEFSTGQDESGGYIAFSVPRLDYWDMIVMERGASAGNGQAEAAQPDGPAQE